MSNIFKENKTKKEEIIQGNAELQRNCEQEVQDNG